MSWYANMILSFLIRLNITHFSSKCGAYFCFVCKAINSGCSSYSCKSYKTVEDYEKSQGNKKDFAPGTNFFSVPFCIDVKSYSLGIKTASEWLVLHERYVAFSKKFLENKSLAVCSFIFFDLFVLIIVGIC